MSRDTYETILCRMMEYFNIPEHESIRLTSLPEPAVDKVLLILRLQFPEGSSDRGRARHKRYVGIGKKGENEIYLTQAQADYIAKLEDDLGWYNTTRLREFIRRQVGCDCPVEMLSIKDAVRVITGLKRL
ncbi:MAG: hypothetical protein J0L94_01065 [Rhodothermia bacterium]|nr:hypothetical protein [Rhodothermia bacterium]